MKGNSGRMPLPGVILVVGLALALLAGCGVALRRNVGAATAQPAAQPSGEYWPTDGWRVADAAALNVDAARLRAMTDFIRLKGLDIKAVVVIRDGYIVFEHYGPGQGPDTRSEVYSVTKSFASTLLGIAQRKGLLGGLDQRILDLLPGEYQNVDAAKQAMTLQDVLTMRSGLAWTEDDATITSFYTSPDPVKFILDLPLAAKTGTAFSYCSGCSHLLTSIVGKVSGMTPQQFAERELFKPLGIKDAQWLTDRQGVAVGGWGLQLTAREMAKLGYLFLRGGTWDGQEIVTREWVAQATARQTATDSEINSGYGYQWWTHAQFPAYMALGRGGQTVYVHPDKDLVVAIRADLPNHDAIWYLIETYVEPAVK